VFDLYFSTAFELPCFADIAEGERGTKESILALREPNVWFFFPEGLFLLEGNVVVGVDLELRGKALNVFDFEKGNLLLEVLVFAAFFVELFTEKSVVFLERVHRSLEVFEMSVEKMLGLLLFQEKVLLVIEF
jgi:hypothetical protein